MVSAPPVPPGVAPPAARRLDEVPFDITAPLPTGTTLLQASAGTGKTWTVGALVTRYIADGVVPLDRLLVVTFGRAASEELRERVRTQLVAAIAALTAAPDGRDDELIATLRAGGPDLVRQRLDRLTRAAADFDSATIATTHQFCQQVLAGLGIAGDTDPGDELVENLDDLVIEVVDDLYVRKFAVTGSEIPALTRSDAVKLGVAAVADPAARLEPTGVAADSFAGLCVRFCQAVREEVEVRKRARGVLGYDDLLGRLAAALSDAGSPARARLARRWSTVLIDEFQDTDPVQWDVVRDAFAGVGTLVLIGDPKQSIYAFRGGDVTTYLAAAATADARATLAVNRRSDRPLVDALQRFFAGAALGDPQIVVGPVQAEQAVSRLRADPQPVPLRLRIVRRELFGRGGRSGIPVDELRPLIAADAADDIARLLSGGTTFDGRPLVARDIAVLVPAHRRADEIRAALAARGIPALYGGVGSVFGTPAAADWHVLLQALEQPHRPGRVRAAALTPFLHLSAADLDAGGDQLTDDLGARLRSWAELLAARGVAALLEVVTAQQDLAAHLLAVRGGERRLTDLRHIGAALMAAAVQDGLGLAALTEWLRQRQAEAATDKAGDRQRRMDSDDSAVQVMTVHASKGLQFPVVYLPFAADRWSDSSPGVITLHDPSGARVLDVGGNSGPGRGERVRANQAEQSGETLRLLYVAMTRAQSQVVAWWAPTKNAQESGLHRLLYGRRPGSPTVAEAPPLPEDGPAVDLLAVLAGTTGIAVETVRRPGPPLDGPSALTGPTLALATFTRTGDIGWRRSSYSSLSAAGQPSQSPGVSSEPETGQTDDEADLTAIADGADGADGAGLNAAAWQAVPSPMAALPAGAAFGTVVHGVLEQADPWAPDLRAELRSVAAEVIGAVGGGVGADELAGALLPVMTTPLGPLVDGRTLAEIGPADRLAELSFELPLAGGDTSIADVRLGRVADLMDDFLPDTDPLRPYARRLRSPEMADQPLRGFLTGSLDLVLRLPGPRYLVADYKTNWLGDPADLSRPSSVGPVPLTAWSYRPDAVRAAMLHSDYPLQALLYSVALHRFLRWRQPGYDPTQQLGGVLYLYVRGMCGPDTPTDDGVPAGVFGWRPPAELVVRLSALLAGRTG